MLISVQRLSNTLSHWRSALFALALLPAMSYANYAAPLAQHNEAIQTTALYHVELLVFENTRQVDPDWHTMLDADGKAPVSQHRLLPQPAEVDDTIVPFQLLPSNQLRMKNEEQKLARQKNYHLLLHIAWRQPLPYKKSVETIHIVGGNAYNDEGKVLGNADLFGGTADLTPYIWQIEGSVQVFKGHYVELNTEFNLNDLPNVSQTPSNSVYQLDTYHLKQHRRLSNGELNYLDHPKFGILVLITPIKSHTTT